MRTFILLYFLCLGSDYFASHIVGGEMTYDYLGKNESGQTLYRLTLKIYRDCASGNAQFDGLINVPAIITIREGNGALTGTMDIGTPIVTQVPPSINSPCIQTPNDICVEEGVYTSTLVLLAKPGGYYIIYQRCCRNSSVDNLVASGTQGSTYYTRIPGPEEVSLNNSARYKKFPPIFLCSDLDFSFDHSASDADGDSLAYSFYTPFQGLDQGCAAIGDINCPGAAGPLPYSNVLYTAGFTGNNPISGSPAFSINPVTGLFTGKPNLIGQFVVGICVREFRNGILINVHYRDFQFNVRSCPIQVVSAMQQQPGICIGNTITFTNTSSSFSSPLTALWDFGITDHTDDTSQVFNPVYIFPDTGKYTVTLIANPYKPCADTSKRDIYIYPVLETSFSPQPAQCLNNNSFTFSASNPGIKGTSFYWTFGPAANPSVSSLQNPENVIFSTSGLFWIHLKAKFKSCIDSVLDSVRVVGLSPDYKVKWDTTVIIGQPIPLNAYADYGFTYTWTPLVDYLNCSTCEQPDPVSSSMGNITYSVLVEDPMHCRVTESTFRIFVEAKTSLDVPSAFTPNGDGINDVIYPAGWGIKKLVYFKVYNRWGQLLFESNDLKQGWDGKFNGVIQNMETYVYQVSAETYMQDQPELFKTGTFKLVR